MKIGRMIQDFLIDGGIPKNRTFQTHNNTYISLSSPHFFTKYLTVSYDEQHGSIGIVITDGFSQDIIAEEFVLEDPQCFEKIGESVVRLLKKYDQK